MNQKHILLTFFFYARTCIYISKGSHFTIKVIVTRILLLFRFFVLKIIGRLKQYKKKRFIKGFTRLEFSGEEVKSVGYNFIKINLEGIRNKSPDIQQTN